MARRKKPEDETPEEEQIRRRMETVADTATRSEKVSWDRKMDNMVKLLAQLRPIEDQVLDLLAMKQPIMDEIAALRMDMVKDCVHPFTHLTPQADGTVQCKFCMKRFGIVGHGGS